MIINIYNALKLKRTSIIFNSMIFFHKYYIYNLYLNQANFDNIKLAYIAIASFLTGTKSSDFKIRIDDILNYSYKCNILCQKMNNENREKVLYYEFEILTVMQFNIFNYGLTYKNAYFVFETIIKSLKIEFKNDSISEKIKEYFIAQIRYSFVFPFFLNYDKKIIILSCANLLLKQLLPNHIISIWENKEYIDIRAEIIECSNIFEQFLNSEKKNKDNIEINNKNDKNITSNEKQINIGIVRTINSTNTNNV